MLDAQRAGCIPEYENMKIPKCHALYDPDCRSDRVIPFLRNRYDFRTGYSPNNPRMQLNEITPWMDGGLVYGPFKAWTDSIRRFDYGELASQGPNGDRSTAGQNADISNLFPYRNDIGLPLANPPPPANNSLFPVNRFWGELSCCSFCFVLCVFVVVVFVIFFIKCILFNFYYTGFVCDHSYW